MPSSLDGRCKTDAQGAMVGLLMWIYQEQEGWGSLSLGAINQHALKKSQDKSSANPFRALPDRVLQKGLSGLCANGILHEEEDSEKLFDTVYTPTWRFYLKILRYFRVVRVSRLVPVPSA
jgi:hypothetical protein